MKCDSVLYGFEPFDFPRVGLFSLEKNPTEFCIEKGWLTDLKEETIIGETPDTYVTRLLNCETGEWVGDRVIKRKYTLPVGIHKSRWCSWTAGQLPLF